MNIALLNQRIIFQKNALVTDNIGNHKNTWVDFYSCMATVGGENGNETAAAGLTVENSEISFSVRFCKKLSGINSTGYRIVFKDELYDIVSIDHMNYKNRILKFRCRKVRR